MSIAHEQSQIVIDLNKILNSNDATEIKQMQTEFESNGWCFVRLPANLIPDPNLVHELSKFFNADQWRSSRGRVYGYSKVNHKEGIKLLTGSYLEEFANKGLVPATLIEPLNYLSQVFDAVTKRLIEVLDQHCVFQQQPSLSSLFRTADLPLEEEQFGMLDIVSYFNEKSGFQPPHNGQTTDEVNCVPHYDPGLLSISVLSTLEGLQLKNMKTDQWVNGPLDPTVGVIWLGEAAARVTQNRLKPGIHRVVYPQESKRRLTIWYEVCTTEQLRNMSAEKQEERMAGGSVTLENLPGSGPITVLPGEKKLDFLKRIEEAYGLSMSKTRPPVYTLEKHNIAYLTESASKEQ